MAHRGVPTQMVYHRRRKRRRKKPGAVREFSQFALAANSSNSPDKACCQLGILIPNVPARRARSSRDSRGRAALAGKSLVETGTTSRTVSSILRARSPCTMLDAKPCQLVEPALAICRIPPALENAALVSPASSGRTAFKAQASDLADVGAPDWSDTTRSSRLSCASLNIVRRKLLPTAP